MPYPNDDSFCSQRNTVYIFRFVPRVEVEEPGKDILKLPTLVVT